MELSDHDLFDDAELIEVEVAIASDTLDLAGPGRRGGGSTGPDRPA
jgi:hypothetical protein